MFYYKTKYMSRQEDFIEAGIQYRFAHGTPLAIGGGNFAEMTKEMNRAKPFEAGAEFGYKYAIEKACEWLEKRGYSEDITKGIIDNFRKAME